MADSTTILPAAFRWGIWGTGGVSRKFASGLRQLLLADLAWVISRDETRANEFAAQIGARNGFSNPAEAFRAGADAVYIATPAHCHAEHAISALRSGLHVLIEKPFAANSDDAKLIAKVARDSGKFAMEAMWTRFQPAVGKAKELLSEGAIGTPRLLRAEFCISSLPSESLHHPQGGGALRQRGIYPLSLASYFFGLPEDASAILRRAPSGVDEDIAIQLLHSGGVLSQLRASLSTTSTNTLEILGDRGALRFEGRIWRPTALRLVSYMPRKHSDGDGRLVRFRETTLGQSIQRILIPFLAQSGERITLPATGNGYGHQAEEVMARAQAGEVESPLMPLEESVALTTLMDRLLDKDKYG